MQLSRPRSRIATSIVFVGHGALFVSPPAAARVKMADGPLSMRGFRRLGWAELLGGAVVLAPALSNRYRFVSKLAEAGLLGVMIPATVLHARQREWISAIATVAITSTLVSLVVE